MPEIKKNSSCPCGSGKKYKDCCLNKLITINMLNYKYDKYLKSRNMACFKIFKIGVEKLGIEKNNSAFYLLEFLRKKVAIDKIKDIEELDIFLDKLTTLFTVFGYPIFDMIDSERELDDFGFNNDWIEINYLWKFCLENFIEEFNSDEKKFLQTLEKSIAGFFKVKKISRSKSYQRYPIIELEDIFDSKTYKIMDKSLSKKLVKHDIISGIVAPFYGDIGVMESCPPIVFLFQDKDILLNIIREYCLVYRKKYKKFFSSKDRYTKVFKLFPIIIYLVALEYYFLKTTRKMANFINFDKENIVLSETIYRFENKTRIEMEIGNIEGVRIAEKGKESIFHWLNNKKTILGIIIIKRKRLYFTTNSMERLKKWKETIKDIPIEYIRTDYNNLDTMNHKQCKIEDYSLDIPKGDFKRIALGWWKRYYDNWVNTKLPALGNITPCQAVKTTSGKEKVKALIDEFENINLHINKNSKTGNNFHKYFDPDELRKRLL